MDQRENLETVNKAISARVVQINDEIRVLTLEREGLIEQKLQNMMRINELLQGELSPRVAVSVRNVNG